MAANWIDLVDPSAEELRATAPRPSTKTSRGRRCRAMTTTARTSSPELHWQVGYVYSRALIVASTLAQLWHFKRKKWF